MSSGTMARRRRIDDHMVLVKNEIVRGVHTYIVEELVGSGAYAAVYRAHDEVGRVVALKEYFPPSHPREVQQLKVLFEREKYVLEQVSPHPLMPSFYEAFEFHGQSYIAQEFIDGSTLAEVITKYKHLENDWTLRWAINLCDSLTFLHERSIVHHDIKPVNLKITPEGHMILLDFGAAQYFGEPRPDVPDIIMSDGELYGTEGYLPPEVEETFVADVQTDIFALGCILYEMAVGDPPQQQRINERNLAITTPLTQRRDIDMGYVKLVTTALSYNTDYRYSSAQIFLQELRKIGPPVPMVTHKTLYFGDVQYRSQNQAQRFRVYNSGSPMDLAGDIICRAPWLKVDVPQFRGRQREVKIICDPTKIPEVNKSLRGDVEVRVREVRSPDGALVMRADTWVVQCYATLIAAKPKAVFVNPTADTPMILAATKGVTVKATLTVQNRGEMVGKFTVTLDNPNCGVSISPTSLNLAPGATGQIAIEFRPNSTSKAGDLPVKIKVAAEDSETSEFPLILRHLSPFDYLKSTLKLSK